MKQARRGKADRPGRNPRQGHDSRRRGASRNNRIVLTAFCWALALIMLGLGVYSALWYVNLGRINRESERYAGLYGGRQAGVTAKETVVDLNVTPTPMVADVPTAVPTPAGTPSAVPATAPAEEPTLVPTAEPTEAPSPVPTAKTTEKPTTVPTTQPTVKATPVPTVRPSETPIPVSTSKPTLISFSEPSPAISAEPTPSPSPVPFGADMPVAVDLPIPTPGSDTLVYALPTAPPVQSSFEALLALNPETVGFLEIEGMLALPVAQRENDNEYYLFHTFEGEESSEGALFLDGMNRLVPEDDCLILYGHNMKNKTMFGKLSAYEDIAYLRRHAVIRFDTLYENRSYVIFAGFVASMKPGDPRYFDVRRFIFDGAEFEKFVLKLQSRSMFKSPIEVEYGDHLLLLVTCDYTRNEGRLILALRQLRPDENENDVWAQAMRTEMK